MAGWLCIFPSIYPNVSKRKSLNFEDKKEVLIYEIQEHYGDK